MWVQKVGAGVQALAYSPDGRFLYSADRGDCITRWDLAERRGSHLFLVWHESMYGLFFAAGGRFLVTRSPTPVVWEVAEQRIVAQIAVEWPAPCSMRAHPIDGTILLLNSGRGSGMQTWDPGTRDFGPAPTGWPDLGPLEAFDVSPDGATAALLGRDTRGVVLVDEAGGRMRAVSTSLRVDWGHSRVDWVRFSPDGKVLAVADGVGFGLHDLTGDRFLQVDGAARTGPVPIFAFHPTAPVFAALNRERLLTLFHRETGQPIRSFDFALGRKVECVAFAPDGLTCAVGGSNKQFAVFDVDL